MANLEKVSEECTDFELLELYHTVTNQLMKRDIFTSCTATHGSNWENAHLSGFKSDVISLSYGEKVRIRHGNFYEDLIGVVTQRIKTDSGDIYNVSLAGKDGLGKPLAFTGQFRPNELKRM